MSQPHKKETMAAIQPIKSILILDDDVLQAKALSKKLEKGGYHITGVTYTGLQAIDSVKRKTPDIALLDINLNGQQIDGIEVGSALQELDNNMIIIYITAYANDENFKKALSTKPHAFIEKPYQMKSLYREIEMAVQQVLQLKAEHEKDLITNEQVTANPRLTCLPNCFFIKKEAGAGLVKIAVSDVSNLEADGGNTYLHICTKNQAKKIYATVSIGVFEKEFSYSEMIRVHNSHMVNLTQVEEVQVKNNGGKLLLKNKMEIPVSRGYVSKFWTGWEQFHKR